MPLDGRYSGDGPGTAGQTERIDLRIDVTTTIDRLRRVSADVFTVTPAVPTERFLHSWHVESPKVNQLTADTFEIEGEVGFLATAAAMPSAQLLITVSTTSGKADVTLTAPGGGRTYKCERRSDALRALELTLDVSKSVGDLIPPAYDTTFLAGPAGMTKRPMGLVEAYREAGIELTVRSKPTRLDDSAPQFERWSDDELHNALGQRFLQDKPDATWPQFAVWGLLAGAHDTQGVAGVMFDNVDGRQRQGFAVFRKHGDFAVLRSIAPGSTPANDAAEAMRSYVFTWVHELGHALNLVHSGAPTWMNNPQSNPTTFWNFFPFSFVERELLHLRHGALNAVIMGGDVFKGGNGHLGDDTDGEASFSTAQSNGDSPIQLTLRARSRYCFAGPVKIEAHIHNPRKAQARIHTPLNPEFARLVVFIQRPDNTVQRYAPLACKLGTPNEETLTALHDDYSEAIDLTYGSGGFYFDKPGQYVVRAYYQSPDGAVVASNALTLSVSPPTSEDESFAQDFFSDDVGTCLYFQGSQAPRLRPAFELLRQTADRRKKELVGADIAASIVKGIGKSFYGIDGDKVTLLEKAKPDEVIALTDAALELYKSSRDDVGRIGYQSVVYARAGCWKDLDRAGKAAVELAGLEAHLLTQAGTRAVSDVRNFLGKLVERRR
jgi:hypothetical protein